jgi:hypothetical protein
MRRVLALAALAALAAGGCGVGPGETPQSVRLTVTDGFGSRTLVEREAPELRGSDTVMRLLQRNARVRTRYGGGFVQSIDGVQGSRRNDWFYYVNGVLADEGAAATELHPGDRIWWDRRDWSETAAVPAVVGSFPEPFVSGVGGERLATRLECDQELEQACDAVQRRLNRLGLPVSQSLIATEGGENNIRLLVGRWSAVREDRALRLIERGPRASGVYARFDPSGRTLTALDPAGRAVRRLGPGTGLVAATRFRDQAPTWVVTGTDAAGVRAAAAAFDETVLAEKYALAISDELPVPLPQVGPR